MESKRDPFTGLDPWPERRPPTIVKEIANGKVYAVGWPWGGRLLILGNVMDEVMEEAHQHPKPTP